MFDDPALLRLIALELGIVPNTSTSMDGDEIKTMLAQLSPEDARRCKRKFRKLHRKLRKSRTKSMVNSAEKAHKVDATRFGSLGEDPSQNQRRRRRELVRNFLHKEVRKLDS